VRRSLPIVLVNVLLSQPLRAQAAELSQVRINAAIDRGVERMADLYKDGVAQIPKPLPVPATTELNRAGLRALLVYTLLKSGVRPHSPIVEKLVARLAFERFDRTYDVACMLLALDALDPIGQRAWIDELAAFLLAHREMSGEYGYPGGGDLSNTQFAALGLRAAATAGVAIPPDVWASLARAVFRHQTNDGGFSYTAADGHSRNTMTAAGVGVLAVCETEFALCGALDPDLSQQMRRARIDGLAWITKWLGSGIGTEHVEWQHYFLYGLERVGGLCGIARIGEHEWYREGATYLVDTQDANGEWHGGYEPATTLFALLFLARATGTASTGSRFAPVTGEQPRSLPYQHTPGTDVPGGMRLEAAGPQPLRMWLTHVVSPANAPFEWPDERARGPHIALVEYLADGMPIEVVLGDPEHPSGEQRFACEHRGLARGHHRLTARVHVRPPEDRGADDARAARAILNAKDRSPAPEDRLILTNGIEVDIVDEVPVAAAEIAFDPALDMLLQSRPKASASSVLMKAPGFEWTAFAARQAIDGNPRSPWIAAAEDAHPMLSVHLSQPQRANLVRIAPARLAPRSPDFLTLPREISVAIDGGAAHVIPVDGSRTWVDLKLPKAMQVNLLEIRLVGRDVPTGAVGIGEIALQLTSD
jgi:hypothetical protein